MEWINLLARPLSRLPKAAYISKTDCFQNLFELDMHAASRDNYLMITSRDDCQGRILPMPERQLLSFSHLTPKALLRRPGIRDSFLAGAILSLYVAVYIGVGFAGVAAIEWAWTKLLS
jgi:hypothetical protein